MIEIVTMLRVTPIYGSTGHHPQSESISLPPTCTLIEYGGVKVIVNVGHDESRSMLGTTVMMKSKNHNNSGGGRSSGEGMNQNCCASLPLELPEADVILLTDSSLQSLGGLPLYFGHDSCIARARRRQQQTLNEKGESNKSAIYTERKIPRVYATFPTLKMGQMNLYDHHANKSLDGSNPGYTLSDVDALFSSAATIAATSSLMNESNFFSSDSSIENDDTTNVNNNNDGNKTSNSHLYPTVETLKYAQTIILRCPNTKQPLLSITPHRAGHLIGASFYVLRRLADETEVIVAPIYHHAKEKHLDSSTLYKYGTACDVLITCCGGPGGSLGRLYVPPKASNNKKPILPSPSVGRDEGDLVETVLSTLRRGGNVLLPVDPSGRVLELLLLLNRHWERHRLGSTYNLCWVGVVARETAEFVRSQLEWMADPLGAMFDSGRGHPYALREVRVFATVNEMEAAGMGGVGMGVGGDDENPTVCLASGSTLDCGPARDLLLKWGENAESAIILTDSRRCVPRDDVSWRKKEKERERRKKRSSFAVTNGNLLTESNVKTRMKGRSETNKVEEDHNCYDGKEPQTPNLIIPQTKNDKLSFIPIVSSAPQTTDDEENKDEENDEISSHSTATQLLLKWCEAKAVGFEMADVVEVDVLVPRREPLAGEELRIFLTREEAFRLSEKARREEMAMLREVELAKGRLRLNEKEDISSSLAEVVGEKMGASSTGSGRTVGTVSGSSNTSREAIGEGTGTVRIASYELSTQRKKKSRFDASLFLRYSKPCHMMFEAREEAVGIGQPDSIAKYGIGESIGRAGEVVEDDYGIAVKPEHFVDIYPSNYAGGSGRIGDATKGLGFGFGSNGRPLLSSTGLPMTTTVDGQGGEGKILGTVVEGEDEEQALEAADLSEGTGIIRGRNNRPPTKVTTSPRQFEVLAEVVFIPLEGRVDANAARQSIRALQPRKVVILGGGKPIDTEKEESVGSLNSSEVSNGSRHNKIVGEAGRLAEVIRSLALGAERESIFVPTDGETVELSVGHAAYSVRLVDTPYRSREEEGVGASAFPIGEIQSCEPYEAKVGECLVSLLDYVVTGKKVAVDGSIVLAPRRLSDRCRNRNVMVSDGDVLLSDLRSEVIAQGMKAEYSALQLIVNGKIVVRKDQTSREINVEGPLCHDFFTVRSLVRAQYKIL